MNKHLPFILATLALGASPIAVQAAEYKVGGGSHPIEYREGDNGATDRQVNNNYYIYADSNRTMNRDQREETIEERQKNQDRRIQQGVDSGELTRREADKLERKDEKLDRRIDRAEDSGNGINRREAGKIDRAQDKQSERIRNQKHDRQDR